MRFDKKISILKKVKVRDKQGGYNYDYEFVQDVLAHISPLKLDISKEIFGHVSLTAVSIVINRELNLDDISKYIFMYNDKKYSDIGSSRIYKHKTYLFLEVLGNEN